MTAEDRAQQDEAAGADTDQEQESGHGNADDDGTKNDVKAKMRAALQQKNTREKGVHADGPVPEKAHGSQVIDHAPKMHRRKAGGGGS